MNVLDIYLAQNDEKAQDTIRDLAINVIDIVPQGTPNIEVITSMLLVVGSILKSDVANGSLSRVMGKKLVAECNDFLSHFVESEIE